MKTAFAILLLGLIVVSQVESLVSGSGNIWGKRGDQVSSFISIHCLFLVQLLRVVASSKINNSFFSSSFSISSFAFVVWKSNSVVAASIVT